MKYSFPMVLGASCLSVLSGCIGLHCDDPGLLILPAQPLNMSVLNSPYDDWNCGAPWTDFHSGESILFSSSRNSQGRQFDLLPVGFRLVGNNDIRVESVGASQWMQRIADRINTDQDELGPSFWSSYRTTPSNQFKSQAAFVFSRGDAANHDLRVLLTEDGAGNSSSYELGMDSVIEVDLKGLNTPQDEGYPTWTKECGKILFHSNRDGRYRIYQATVPLDSTGPYAWLRNPDMAGVEISGVAGLASVDGEERCPLLLENRLYFVSDRKGGEGGFDIYRSIWNGTSWSPPENLGSRINSPSNEYRPYAFYVSRTFVDQGPDALIFSSDRPGGLGGYDLHLVALPESR